MYTYAFVASPCAIDVVMTMGDAGVALVIDTPANELGTMDSEPTFEYVDLVVKFAT
jgi:hypothetical protein